MAYGSVDYGVVSRKALSRRVEAVRHADDNSVLRLFETRPEDQFSTCRDGPTLRRGRGGGEHVPSMED